MTASGYRHEFKYVISQSQIPLLRSRISGFMKPDSHAENGLYSIRSLYFDDYQNSCYFDNENGIDPREKFRLRIYNHCLNRISLECKRKEHGKTLKTSCLITHSEAQMLIQGLPVEPQERNLLNKFNLKITTQLLKPVIIVEYERIPYIFHNGNVRVTFDTNICSSESISGFLNPEIPVRPIMPPGWQLLEVKYDSFLPDTIYRALNLGTLEQTAYSKYYLCRRYALKGSLII